MKFGKSIDSQREGQTKFRYVNYKALKKGIKDVVGKVQSLGLGEAMAANMAFEEGLAGEIRQVNDCFAQNFQERMTSIASLAGEFGPKEQAAEGDEFDPKAVPALHDHATNEVGSFLQRLVEIVYDVDQLRTYAVWNAVAVVKILKKRRKLTKFGLEDMAAERTGWLSRQSFFNGAEFAELQAAVESLGALLLCLEPAVLGGESAPGREAQKTQTCPICLNSIKDVVELECGHGFCWKCFVLGPIAFLPGEYRITQCPICRRDSKPGGPAGERFPREGTLSLFLHTYFAKDERATGSREAAYARDDVGALSDALLGDLRRGLHGGFPQTLPKARGGTIGAAQKLQWLELASMRDPLALESSMVCSICSEPLLMEFEEQTLVTPCKHHFHRACIQKLDMPACPCCEEPLPFSLFLPDGHPCAEHGFSAIPPEEYRPPFPGGPSRGSGGYPLHHPPPETLLGPGGLQMRSYLHHVVPATPTPPRSPPPRLLATDSLGEAASPTPSAHCLPRELLESLGPVSRGQTEGLLDDAASQGSEASGCSSGDSSANSEEDFLRTNSAWASSSIGRMQLVQYPWDLSG